jgi:hypothetical protein
MSVAAGYTQYDLGWYLAKQSAKGSVPTTFKQAGGPTQITPNNNKNVIPGEPTLGGGAYQNKAVGTGFDTGLQVTGIWTLDILPALILAGLAVKGTTTTVNTTVQHHPYTLLTRNSNMPYLSDYEVWGEVTPGTGIQTILRTDLRLTAFSLTISTTDLIKFSATYAGLNEGPGAASPTLVANLTYNNPVPVDTVNNLFTFPSFFPVAANVCLESVTINWNANPVQGPFCLGSGERSDNYITRAAWSLDFSFMNTTDMVAVYDSIVYGSSSPTANARQMTTAIKEGAWSCLLNSAATIAGSSPATPYSQAFSFPSLQWYVVKLTDDTPQKFAVTANSFGNDATMAVENLTTSSNMGI